MIKKKQHLLLFAIILVALLTGCTDGENIKFKVDL